MVKVFTWEELAAVSSSGTFVIRGGVHRTLGAQLRRLQLFVVTFAALCKGGKQRLCEFVMRWKKLYLLNGIFKHFIFIPRYHT